MNYDKPLNPGEELEIKVTALLMGELSSNEVAELREQMTGNADLRALHERLARAFDLIRAAVPLDDKIEQITPARLSNEKRERLLRRFKATAISNPAIVSIDQPRKRWTWLAPLSWAASFTIAIGVLVAMMTVPAMKSSRVSGIGNPQPEFYSERYALQPADTDSITPPPAGAPILNYQAPAAPSAAAAPARPAAAAPVTPALAAAEPVLPYYRGRGAEETGRSFFSGGASGGPSPTPSPAAKPASPQPAVRFQSGAAPLYAGTISGARSELAAGQQPATPLATADSKNTADRPTLWVEDESAKLNVNTAGEGVFWDKNAIANSPTPGQPASGAMLGDASGLAANGSVSDRERALASKVESLVQEKEKLATDLAEAKTMTDTAKQESVELKSTLGEVEKSLEQLKMTLPSVSPEELAAKLKEAAPDASRGEPAIKGTKDMAGTFAGRAIGLGDLQDRSGSPAKADAPAPLAAPVAAPSLPTTGGVAGAAVDSLSATSEKKIAGKIVAGVAFERTQPEAPADPSAGDVLSRSDRFGDQVKRMPSAETSLGLQGAPGVQNAPITLFGTEAKPAQPVEEFDSDFSIVDGANAASQPEPVKRESARRMFRGVSESADVRGFDLTKKQAAVNGVEVYDIDAQQDGKKAAARQEAITAYNEARSKLLLGREGRRPASALAPKPEAEITDPVPSDDNWYFKQDGTLAKTSKEKAADVNGPAQQLEDLTVTSKSGQKAQIAVSKDVDAPVAAPKAVPPVPQPEVATKDNAFSTFSLNVSDVAFKLAGASLEQSKMPDPAAIRSEEFINAFDYRDPEPAGGAPLAFASERARYPFAQNRDLVRLSIKTAAVGRQPGRPLNLVLLVDNSGSMERADRVQILRESLRVLANQLQPADKLSVITFARTPHLWVDGVAGNQAAQATERVGEITPQGGTNLSAALDLAYETARKHYQVTNINRVVLLTDGAANLGDVNPAALKQKVEEQRKQGVALDCFGVGWEGYNDDLLEQLSRNGDGRYGFINSSEAAAGEFAGQLAGALRVAASDVKVQVEFNPKRVTAYRQIGYAKHQLTKEQFRDNTVDAAEIGAAESGNALYVVEVNPKGEGDLATVRARFKVPGTNDYREHEWTISFSPAVPALEEAGPTLRLAATASAFSEWLAGSPYAAEITSDKLLGIINGVPQAFGSDPRPQKLEWMIRQAKSLSGR